MTDPTTPRRTYVISPSARVDVLLAKLAADLDDDLDGATLAAVTADLDADSLDDWDAVDDYDSPLDTIPDFEA